MDPEDRTALVEQLVTLQAALDEAEDMNDRPEYRASLMRQIAEVSAQLGTE